jgi:hypothetical protein
MYMVSVAPKPRFAAWATAYRAKLAALVRMREPLRQKARLRNATNAGYLYNSFDLDIVRQYCR